MAPGDEDDEDDDEPKPQKRGRGDDAPSEKQLGFLRALKARLKLDDAALSKLIDEVTGDEAGRVEDLNRRETSQVIDELMIRMKEAGIDLDADAPKATEKQVGFMKSLKRRAHLTDAELAALLDEVAGVKDLADVSKRDASVVIDKLLALANESKPGGKPTAVRGEGSPGKAPAKKKSPARARETPPSPPPPPEDRGGEPDDDEVPF